jgi:hypothetical protein
MAKVAPEVWDRFAETSAHGQARELLALLDTEHPTTFVCKVLRSLATFASGSAHHRARAKLPLSRY